MLARVLSRRLAIASVALGLFAATEAASAQVSVRFGRGGGVGIGIGRGNPYRGSGYNPYVGGAYARGGRNDWYYDRYQPRRFGGGGHSDAVHHGGRNWGAYRNPGLYGPSGPYNGYGYGHGHH